MSIWLSLARSLAAFDIRKPRDAHGAEIEQVVEYCPGSVTYVFFFYSFRGFQGFFSGCMGLRLRLMGSCRRSSYHAPIGLPEIYLHRLPLPPINSLISQFITSFSNLL